MEKSSKKDPLIINAVLKGLQVLEVFTSERPEMSLMQIAKQTGLPKQTVQRLANTLLDSGYLVRDSQSKLFSLSIKTVGFLYNYIASNTLSKIAFPYLVDLREKIGQRVSLAVRDGLNMMYLIRLSSFSAPYQTTLTGRRVPLFSTSSGRSILASLPDEEARILLEQSEREPLTPKTKTEIDEIMEEIRLTRGRGYGLTSEETVLGENNTAALVYDPSGSPVCAIAIVAPAHEWSLERMEKEIVPTLLSTSRAILAS